MTAETAPQRPATARAFAYVSFAIMAGGWVAFTVALVGAPQTLDDVWTAVGDLPLVLEAPAWLLGFPFLLGLAIWQAGWDEGLRLALIGVLAVGYTLMFLPRRRSWE
jgi:hypothetical protein